MASQVTLKALGLNYSPNNLALPEGSLVVADDVIIRRDNVIESRRGFKEYSEQFGAIDDRSKQLITYKNRILNHYSDVLQYESGILDSDGKAIFEDFAGNYEETQTGLRIKSIEANKNLYFTTSQGIKKIAARTAADFTTASGFIKNAGGTKSLDFIADLDVAQGQNTGFLPSDAAVAYRTLWGYRDLNDNLILGTPSDSVSVYNYLESLVPLDLNAFLVMLDNIAQNNPTPPVSTTYASVLHNITTNGVDTFGSSESFASKFGVSITDDASLFASNLLSAATYLDKFSLLADTNAITTIKPLRIGKFENAGGIGTVTFATTYTFTISSATFVAGDVYTNGGQAFTVVSSGTGLSVVMTGYGNPTTPSPTETLTRISGTGAATLTYTAFTSSSNNPSDVFSIGDYIELQGAADSVNLYTFNVSATATVAVGDVYSNNSKAQSYIAVSSLNNATGNLLMIGTGAPTGTTLNQEIGSGTGTVTYTGTPSVASSTYSILNNTTIGTAPNVYWQITVVDDTNKKVKFNTPSTFATVYQGSPGSSTQLLPYNYRYITTTGDNVYSTPLDELSVSSPATHGELATIQHNIERILSRLAVEKTKVIATASQTAYVSPFAVTTAANVNLTITIPTTILNNTDYFLQVYRTRNFTCSDGDILGTTVIPDDEMRLVYEAYPTPAEFSAGFMAFQDTYPEELRDNNVNLYTNPVTGEGISQANDVPPIAKDINRFKNVLFYANTKTRHRLNPLQLLGTAGINAGDTITISNNTTLGTKNYVFVEGAAQQTDISFATAIVSDLTNRSFTLYSANDLKKYYVWFRTDNSNITFTSVTPGVGITTFNTLTPHNIPVSPSSKIFLSGLSSATNVNGAQTVTVTGASSFTIPVNCGVVSSFASAFAIPYVDDAIGLRVDILTGDTLAIITNKFLYNLNALALDFICTSPSSGNISILNAENGKSTNASVNTISGSVMTFTITSGVGENGSASPPEVLLVKASTAITAAQAIDQTARSLVRIINEQANSPVNAYYISSSSSLPGQINLESKVLTDEPFYIQASTVAVGASFTPNIEPYNPESASSGAYIADLGTQVEFTTVTPHGLNDTDTIFISLAEVIPTSPPPANLYLNGIYSVTDTTSTTFRINLTPSEPFVSNNYDFAWSRLSDVSVSNNETRPNRVYYSKLLQPEAVPLLNYFDIGSEDAAILRIFPLRDSLFVFKQDGLFRISGETAPFVITLFDSSCVLIAPDTVSIANNIVYGWTSKGISNVTEAGVTEISRAIDTVVLKLASSNYTNFSTASWGLGYDSDNSYTVYTCENTDDELATIGFRFSNLTNTWTNFQRSQTCGVINPLNDRIYTGSGVNNVIDQERKNFDRTDYSDKDFDLTLGNGFLSGNNITISSTAEVEVGDVLTQTQGLTVYKYNALLDKLDLDSSVGEYGYNVTSPTGTTTITIQTTAYGTVTPPINHNLSNGDWINVDSSDTNPSIDGEYQVIIPSYSVQFVDTGDLVVQNDHGLSNGTAITFTSIVGTTGISTGTTYYVISATTNNFQLSLIPAGPAVTLTNNGTGVYLLNTSFTSFNIEIPEALSVGTNPLNLSRKITRNYSKTLQANIGDNLRNKVVQLAAYLDTDPKLTPPVSPPGITYSNIVANYTRNITSVNATNPATVNTTPTAHKFLDDRVITISGTNTVIIPSINGTYSINVTGTFPSNFNSTSFQIPVAVTTPDPAVTTLTATTSGNDLTIEDIAACFNGIVKLLNQPTSGTSFKNYKLITDTTLFEAVVTSVNKTLNFITLNLPIQLTVGDVTIYKAIPCNAVYAPITFGDPLQLKQVYEATLMFADKAFTKVIAGFSSDLKPEFTFIEFDGQGNGMFGNYSNPGFGYGFFGGSSNAAPCRTIIPRQNQRCRFINMQFSHKTAREIWSLYGITLTLNQLPSTRAYR